RLVGAEADGAKLAASEVALAGNVARAPALQDLAGFRGSTTAPGAAEDFASAFPRLVLVIGSQRVRALAALSRLGGMVCPGLHSIFAGFTVDLVESNSQRSGIGFEVTKLHQQYRMI